MAARKKSTGDERVDAQVAAERLGATARAEKAAQDAARERFGAKSTSDGGAVSVVEYHEKPTPDVVEAFRDVRVTSARASVEAKVQGVDQHNEPMTVSLMVEPEARITKLQLHTRAHILGIQGTSDSLVVGDVIESIEPDMLGPIPGFVVRLKRGAPVFMPQASVLAVTVVS